MTKRVLIMALAIVFILFLSICHSVAHAGIFTAFGPRTFIRESGKTVAETASFNIKNPNTSYTLKIYNGGANSEYSKVSSAIIKLNGSTIFDTNDFNQQVSSLQKQVNVSNSNQLQVELRSLPGSGVTVAIEGIDNTPPEINITSSSSTTYTNTSSITVTGTASDSISRVTAVTVNSTTANLSGESYSANIKLSEGTNAITAAATDAAGNTGSASATIILDTAPPTVTITSPANQVLLNKKTVNITGAASDTLSGLDKVTINALQATISGDIYNSNIELSEGSNNITATATDKAGNRSSSSITVNVDTIPPTILTTTPKEDEAGVSYDSTITANFSEPIDPASITTSSFTLNSASGTVAGTVTYSINSATFTPLGQLDPDITYTASIKGGLGGIKDLAGNALQGGYTLNFTTKKPVNQLKISITEPQSGANINRETILIKGSVTSTTADIGIKVNGIVAEINGTNWVAQVPLQIGQNTLEATATDAAGNTDKQTITIKTQTTDQLVKITTNPTSGIGPLNTTFSIDTSISNPISSYKIDVDGDGVTDLETTDVSNITYTYNIPGIYYPNVIVTDDQNNTYTEATVVNVLDKTQMDVLIKAKWEGMKGALTSADVEKAVNSFDSLSKEKYLNIFTMLKSHLSEIASNMQEIRLIYLKEDIAEYRISRTENIDGQIKEITYFIYFVKDKHGLWKIGSF